MITKSCKLGGFTWLWYPEDKENSFFYTNEGDDVPSVRIQLGAAVLWLWVGNDHGYWEL